MEPNTGYMISEDNIHLLFMLSGKEKQTLQANLGWVLVWKDSPYSHWVIVPKNVAERIPGFRYADSVLNGLPARTEAEIRAEWKEVNDAYAQKQTELREELARATLRASESGQALTEAGQEATA